ncbi:Putative protein FAM170B [Heterocephalus glaber]|uniref:Uncharacterized protein n=1 Tax=Heterocephalus glaber TaxID=10181 RepID=G5B0W6_HETGA|nr:Putative protein FAM170B [Heterocephalus glaber]
MSSGKAGKPGLAFRPETDCVTGDITEQNQEPGNCGQPRGLSGQGQLEGSALPKPTLTNSRGTAHQVQFQIMKRHFEVPRREDSSTDVTTLSVTSPESMESSLKMCWPGTTEGPALAGEARQSPRTHWHFSLGWSPSSPSSESSSSYRSYSQRPSYRLGPRGDPDPGPRSVPALYTRVQTVRGVAVAWETEAGFAPVSSRPRVREAQFLNRQRWRGSSFEVASNTDLRGDLEVCGGEREAEPEEDSGREDDELEQEPRAPPDSLHGVREGCSCQIFFEEMLEKGLERGQAQDPEPEPEPEGEEPSHEEGGEHRARPRGEDPGSRQQQQ